MSEIRQKDSTSNIVYILIRSKTSTPVGMGLTGLAFNTAGLVFSYVRDQAARVGITLVTQTVTGAWTSGGFVEIDPVNSPGLYRLGVPDAAFVTGVKKVRITWTGANSIDDGTEVDLTVDDPYAAGLTLAQIAGAVWDELRSAHVVAGSFGEGVLLAGASIWAALTSTLTTVGSIGKLLVDNINATVGSRSTQASVDTVAGYVDTEVAAILAAVDTEVGAIKTKTDQLTFTIANKVNASIQAAGDFVQAAADKVWATTARTVTTLAGTPATDVADALLARNQKGGSNGPAGQTVAAAIAGGFMNFTIAAGVLTVMNGDGTVAFTRNVTRDDTLLLGAIVGAS